MAATTKFKARAALLECLREVPGLAGVVIDYYDPDEPPEMISLGPTIQDDTTQPRAMTQSPVKQQETYTILLGLFVGSKAKIGENEARADELLDHIMTTLAENYTLGIESTGFQSATVSRIQITSGHVVDQGPRCGVELSIECKGRI